MHILEFQTHWMLEVVMTYFLAMDQIKEGFTQSILFRKDSQEFKCIAI